MADLAKVKRNIGRMIDQGAPEADIDAYVASEGVSLADLQTKRQMASPRAAEDASMSALEQQTVQKPYSGMLAPFSVDQFGQRKFDSNAGLMGMAKRIAMLPGEAMQGKIDPTSQEGMGRTIEMAAAISPVPAAMRAGERAIPGVLNGTSNRVTPKAPTAAKLKAASDAGYKKAADMGVEYSAKAVKGLADDIARGLDEEGFIAELAPKTRAVLGKLQQPPTGAVSARLQSIDAARKVLNRVAGSPDATEAAAANRAIRQLDGFLETANPQSVVAGTPAATGLPARVGEVSGRNVQADAAKVLSEARGNAAARFRSDRLTGVEDAAELRAAAANSGQNLGNSIRQRVASLLLDPKKSRGFSEKELAALRQVVEGTATENTLRRVSNWLGGGGGLGQSFMAAIGAGVGGTAGGVPGGVAGAMIPAAIGSGTRAAANALTSRSLGAVDDLVRMRSPLYNQMVREAPEAVSPELQQALLKAFLANQATQRR